MSDNTSEGELTLEQHLKMVMKGQKKIYEMLEKINEDNDYIIEQIHCLSDNQDVVFGNHEIFVNCIEVIDRDIKSIKRKLKIVHPETPELQRTRKPQKEEQELER